MRVGGCSCLSGFSSTLTRALTTVRSGVNIPSPEPVSPPAVFNAGTGKGGGSEYSGNAVFRTDAGGASKTTTYRQWIPIKQPVTAPPAPVAPSTRPPPVMSSEGELLQIMPAQSTQHMVAVSESIPTVTSGGGSVYGNDMAPVPYEIDDSAATLAPIQDDAVVTITAAPAPEKSGFAWLLAALSALTLFG